MVYVKKNPEPKVKDSKRNSGVDNNDLLKRTLSTSKVKLVPYIEWISISINASTMLF